MTWPGSLAWPPTWGGSYRPGQKFAHGEVGDLIEVKLIETSLNSPNHLTLEAKYEGETISGDIRLDDPSLLEPLYQRLRECTGRSIREIGDLEIDF